MTVDGVSGLLMCIQETMFLPRDAVIVSVSRSVLSAVRHTLVLHRKGLKNLIKHLMPQASEERLGF